jgi:hypothetical protein
LKGFAAAAHIEVTDLLRAFTCLAQPSHAFVAVHNRRRAAYMPIATA